MWSVRRKAPSAFPATTSPPRWSGASFLKLNSEHIRFVVGGLKENTTRIRNMRQYLLATLYNAPLTIGNYYRSLVSHDMSEGFI